MINLLLFVDTSANNYSVTDMVTNATEYITLFQDYGKVFLFMLLIAALISQVVRTN